MKEFWKFYFNILLMHALQNFCFIAFLCFITLHSFDLSVNWSLVPIAQYLLISADICICDNQQIHNIIVTICFYLLVTRYAILFALYLSMLWLPCWTCFLSFTNFFMALCQFENLKLILLRAMYSIL